MLEVLQRGDGLGGPIQEDIGTGTYRLLFRVLASHPEEVRSFYEDTVASIVRYDDQYRTDLVQTLEAYLEHNCNMNATAAAIYAHRHTVAYRLERVKELSGLDPMQTEDRERLGLGLKAYRDHRCRVCHAEQVPTLAGFAAIGAEVLYGAPADFPAPHMTLGGPRRRRAGVWSVLPRISRLSDAHRAGCGELFARLTTRQ